MITGYDQSILPACDFFCYIAAEITANFPGIPFRRGASGIPIPVLRGTGIPVQTIVISSREWNESMSEIAAQYSPSEELIKEALRFYRAHQAEVDLLIQSNTRLEYNKD